MELFSTCTLVELRIMAFHQYLRVLEVLEPELSVQTVCIAGRQHEATQALQFRMRHHGGHQALAQPEAAMRWHDEYVGQVGEGRPFNVPAGARGAPARGCRWHPPGVFRSDSRYTQHAREPMNSTIFVRTCPAGRFGPNDGPVRLA